MRTRLSIRIVTVVAVLLPAVPVTANTSGTMTIWADTTLTEDHDGWIVIDADNVTLDCDGHVVTGSGYTGDIGSGTGVSVFHRTEVVVTNCEVTGFERGFDLRSSTDVTLTGNNAHHNAAGVELTDSNDCSVIGNKTADNNHGIDLYASSGNLFEANTADGNWTGFQVSYSTGNTFTENTSNGNGLGFHIASSSGNFIIGNTASDNTGMGFLLEGADTVEGNVLDSNKAIQNAEQQFVLWGVHRNHLVNNVADGGLSGFWLDASIDNTLEGNTATNASEAGFNLVEGMGNVFIENLAISNSGNGIYVSAFSEGNVFTGNSAHLNGFYGIQDESWIVWTLGELSVGNLDERISANSYTGNLCIGNSLGSSYLVGLCNPSGSFTDDDGSVFEFDIEWLAASGITKGCNPPTNDMFCPAKTVTRGQMAAFLHRAVPTLPEVRPAIDFTDDDDSIFEGDIEWLYSRGVTQGNTPTTFNPDGPVTRGQMAAFLVRALKYTDDGGGDLFIDDDNSIFEGDIDRLGTAGVTRGCNPSEGNTKFCPDSNVTRGQMAAFLHRALGG